MNFFYFLTALLLAILGFLDARYLTLVHYKKIILVCTQNTIFVDCGKVLQTQFAVMFGIPLAVLGIINYSLLIIDLLLFIITRRRFFQSWLVVQTAVAMVASLYFMYLQIFIIKSLCLYCTASAVISFLLFFLVFSAFRQTVLHLVGGFYGLVIKRIFFLFDAEQIHETIINFGETLGKSKLVTKSLSRYLTVDAPSLKQTIAGITFANPVGLAAGFDYEAKLTRILPAIGFGFQTVGTITNRPYRGNPPPRLGRLPKSKSLLVNKGFKNLGADETINQLIDRSFAIPVGVSIGRTNSRRLTTQKESVKDVACAFVKFEKSKLRHAYYELNISCPNLYGNIDFYSPKNLEQLLTEIEKLKIKKPVFVKMPIEKSGGKFLTMLKIISRFSFVAGVIIGNLQKDRNDPAFDSEEIRRAGRGNFSGKPTWSRSNELIKLAHQNYRRRFVIVGCGGVFSAQDAYRKIKLGASLVQLITGMVYQGPQLAAEINFQLPELLKQDRLKNIHDAIGISSVIPDKR